MPTSESTLARETNTRIRLDTPSQKLRVSMSFARSPYTPTSKLLLPSPHVASERRGEGDAK
jgi:hypothetical protein